MRVISLIFPFILGMPLAFCEERANLMLRAFVPPKITTKIVQTQLTSSKRLITFSSQVNSRQIQEGQKFEVEGLDQSGLEGEVKLLTGTDRTVQGHQDSRRARRLWSARSDFR